MARDKVHDVVVETLEKDGWQIAADPLLIEYGDDRIAIDLAAERLILLEQGANKIAIEVKSFSSKSILYAFHQALGQYINYKMALDSLEESYPLYLAIDDEVFEKFQERKLIMDALSLNQVRLLIFDIVNKNVVQWIE